MTGVSHTSAATEQAPELRLEWRSGAPTKPWSEEWFIAETIWGDRVVLRALPEEWTYDFKTADDTYIKHDKIKRWMQFPDSEFIAPDVPVVAQGATKPVAWLADNGACTSEERVATHWREQLFRQVQPLYTAQLPAAPVETKFYSAGGDGTFDENDEPGARSSARTTAPPMAESLRWEALESSGHNKRARKMFLAAAEEIERLNAPMPCSAKSQKLVAKYQRILERARMERRDHMQLRVFQNDMEAIIAALRSGDQPQEALDRVAVAKAIYDVSTTWLVSGGMPPHLLCSFDKLGDRDRNLHLAYADAVLALSRPNHLSGGK